MPHHTYRRGFVEQITCSAANWLAHGDEIRWSHPVTRVALTTLTADDRAAIFRRLPAGTSVVGRLFSEIFWLVWPGVTFELPANRWTGAANQDMADSRNWSHGVVPVAGDEVLIPGPTVTPRPGTILYDSAGNPMGIAAGIVGEPDQYRR